MKSESIYLNTDLDIVSSDDLGPLAEIFDKKCALLHGQKEDDGLWYLTVESEDSGSGCGQEDSAQLQRDLNDLLNVIEGLENSLRSLLARADRFDFNIGWEAGTQRPEGVLTIPSDLLRRITDSGATLTVTIYPPEATFPENTDRKSSLPYEPKVFSRLKDFLHTKGLSLTQFLLLDQIGTYSHMPEAMLVRRALQDANWYGDEWTASAKEVDNALLQLMHAGLLQKVGKDSLATIEA
ncbi:MAG: hypothetical protein PVH19_01685, partial [Planctomycetia bacterium]